MDVADQTEADEIAVSMGLQPEDSDVQEILRAYKRQVASYDRDPALTKFKDALAEINDPEEVDVDYDDFADSFGLSMEDEDVKEIMAKHPQYSYREPKYLAKRKKRKLNAKSSLDSLNTR